MGDDGPWIGNQWENLVWKGIEERPMELEGSGRPRKESVQGWFVNS